MIKYLENMREQGEVERNLMDQEEFEKYITDSNILKIFEAIGKFKSVQRAIKRGHVTIEGIIMPKRPFNNRANTSKRKGVHSRGTNELKKHIYEQIRQYQRKSS